MLTDFGIAKSLDAPGMTGTGVLLGTPDYMAPEQIRGAQVVDGRADIYALGVLVFRCLTGRRPFEGGTDEVLLGHLPGRAADPSLIEPSLPNAVDLVIHKAMARRPADRYSTAGAFAQALGAAAGMDQPTPPPARRRDAEGRVVVPRVAVEGLTRQHADMDAVTRKGVAAPPGARPAPAVAVTPLQRSRSRGGAGGFMVAALLVLLVGGGGLLLAQSVQRGDAGSGAVVAVATPEPTTGNLVHNGSLETLRAASSPASEPVCFQQGGANVAGNPATWALTSDAHSGTVAERVGDSVVKGRRIIPTVLVVARQYGVDAGSAVEPGGVRNEIGAPGIP